MCNFVGREAYIHPLFCLKMKKINIFILLFLGFLRLHAEYLLIPMDYTQSEHLKGYGIAYWVIEHGVEVDWLLNYKGGSFMFKYVPKFEQEMQIRGVKYEKISDSRSTEIIAYITSDAVNMDAVKLEKPPKVAVYSPKNKQPWDDAVTLALTYAEIPYDVVYDDEVLEGKLKEYDWLHLHHEDFTGQYGKFWGQYQNAAWYKEDVQAQEATAKRWGYAKVSQMKLAVAKTVKEFMGNGGFLFAMCSATDTYDIGLSAEGTDICAQMFDGDAANPNAQNELDFNKTLAFKDFQLTTNPYQYEFSTIDMSEVRNVPEPMDYFSLFEFSAKSYPHD
jgi:hypothetical protein